MEDTEPRVQRLFHGLYRETGIGSQDLAGAGFSVPHASSYQLAFYFMKKYLIVLILLLAVPSLVFASWWNPFSWFKKKEIVTIVEPPVNSPNPFTDILKKPESAPVKEYTNLSDLIRDSRPKSSVTQKTKSPSTTISIQKVITEPADIIALREEVKKSFQDEIDIFDKEHGIQSIFKNSIEYQISDLNDSITNNEGIEMDNPDYAPLGKYLDRLTKSEIEFQEKNIASKESFIDWLEKGKIQMQSDLLALDNLKIKEELDAQLENLQLAKNNLDKSKALSDKWDKAFHDIKIKDDGIVTGISGKLKAETSMPAVSTPSYPPTFTPTSFPFQLHCTSTRNLGDIETSCY